MSNPPVTNLLTYFIDGIISAAMKGGEVAVEGHITADMPFLAAPPLQYILDYIVQGIGDAVNKNIATIVNAVIYDFQTNGENSAVLQAALKLKTAQQNGVADEISKATSDLIGAYANLIHSDGPA